ncbi:MAG: hypothetical protein HEQ27_06085 [Dolichospermum sp. JUN01]|nr:hypothetical protein [Dolichospermum sp. LEGE 00246]MBO1056106.1 hypothetical protein [Dolichospermum sp. JUN01]MBS9396071.1 hypothetical protein [Dolichospermum sp. OL01]MCO5799847.1 hypothetical protein [Dolichospermum sp. OL03]MTJ36987.1 hypothetical protein [Dolichospermum sp. UHCC 0260]
MVCSGCPPLLHYPRVISCF